MHRAYPTIINTGIYFLEISECSNYNVLDEPGRSISYGESNNCDQQGPSSEHRTAKTSDNWKGPGWYRLLSPAGSRIPEAPPGLGHCTTKATGWVNQTHPIGTNELVDATFCFNFRSDICKWKTEGKIKNCGDFFVYYLVDTPWCNLRYCGTD